MRTFTVDDLVHMIGGRLLSGSGAAVLHGFASLREALPGDLSFFDDKRYTGLLRRTEASAVLVPEDWTEWPPRAACVAVSEPSLCFEKVVESCITQPEPLAPGFHSSAVIADSAQVDAARTHVGANAVIDEGAVVEDGVEIGPGCYIGCDARIGQDSRLAANSTVLSGCRLGRRVILHPGVVIGADGFGYKFEGGRHRKVRQCGVVQIDDDVEIGAGTTVDRARFGRTWIGEGTKIDNLVQIGHNVIVGRHCIIVACTAIAGSAVIGDYVVVAAQVGIAGHVTVGSQSRIGARAAVTKDLPAGQSYLGFPAVTAMEERRRIASARRLPAWLRRIEALEAQLKAIQLAAEVAAQPSA